MFFCVLISYFFPSRWTVNFVALLHRTALWLDVSLISSLQGLALVDLFFHIFIR